MSKESQGTYRPSCWSCLLVRQRPTSSPPPRRRWPSRPSRSFVRQQRLDLPHRDGVRRIARVPDASGTEGALRCMEVWHVFRLGTKAGGACSITPRAFGCTTHRPSTHRKGFRTPSLATKPATPSPRPRPMRFCHPQREACWLKRSTVSAAGQKAKLMKAGLGTRQRCKLWPKPC